MSIRQHSPAGAVSPAESQRPRNGLGREHVADIQRARMLTAMTEVCAERGAGNVTVAHVVAHSGVSRRTFYEIFEDRQDCFLAAFDDGVARAFERATEAYDPSAKWQDRIRSALTALLRFFDERPAVGRLVVVESLGVGPHILERRRDVLAQVIAAVDQGRDVGRPAPGLPSLTAEGAVGAVFAVLYSRLVEGDASHLIELVNPLMGMIVLPYLGSSAARRELERSAPSQRMTDGSAASDPLADLGMRLTYRTVRVLMSVAAGPGSSNREIGVASGISDQGQISKLLSRLERLGLVENLGLTPGHGAPNAWGLTEKGVQIERVMSAETSRRVVS